jgi:hypothetical protein
MRLVRRNGRVCVVTHGWASVEGVLTVFEDEAALDLGRRAHHGDDSGRAAHQAASSEMTVTSRLRLRAVRDPVCFQLDNLLATDRDTPSRALYTASAWLARWADGTLSTGDSPNNALGDFGLQCLLWGLPLEALELPAGEAGAASMSTLLRELPALAVLGAESYRWVADTAHDVLSEWTALVAGREARRLVLAPASWDQPVEFVI